MPVRQLPSQKARLRSRPCDMEEQARRLQGRSNRSKGLGFEKRLVQKLKDFGIQCRRNIDEVDGFDNGTDLILYSVLRPFTSGHPEVRARWPVALQCKFTQNELDLFKGFGECRAGQPDAKLWCCVWGDSRKRNTRLRCVWVHADCDKLSHQGDLRDLVDALRVYSPVT
jgi:hypothetical protein